MDELDIAALSLQYLEEHDPVFVCALGGPQCAAFVIYRANTPTLSGKGDAEIISLIKDHWYEQCLDIAPPNGPGVGPIDPPEALRDPRKMEANEAILHAAPSHRFPHPTFTSPDNLCNSLPAAGGNGNAQVHFVFVNSEFEEDFGEKI